MKVLYLVSGIGPPAGWGTEFIQKIIFNLSKKGLKTTIINPIYKHTDKNWQQWSGEQEKKYGVGIISLEAPALIRQNLYLHLAITPLLVTWATFKLLRREKYDLVHEFSSTPIILLRSLLIKLLFNISTVFSLSVYNNTFLGSLHWMKIFNFAHTYCIPSTEIANYLLSLGLPKKQIKIVPPAIEFDKYSKSMPKFTARKKLNLPEDKFIIGYFGSLTDEKGVGDLLAAISLLPAKIRKRILVVIWTIWKGSSQHQKYIKLIKNLNFSNLRLAEMYVNIPTVLAASDLLIFPQQTGHGATIPQISILESLAAKKKVLATNILGNRDLFLNPKQSLATAKNPTNLAKKIVGILKLNSKTPSLKINIEDYDLARVAQLYFQIYHKILN